MKIDCHMHTPLCGHSKGEPREFVRAAADNGIGLITFTCHIPMDNDPIFRGAGIRMCSADLPEYVALVEDARKEGEKLGVRVLRGIEGEVYHDESQLVTMDRVLREWEFDFVLGSLHHQLPGFRQWIKDQGITDDGVIVDTYFTQLAAGVRTGRYDSMSHPDVIRIYGTVGRFEPEEHETSIKTFLQALVDTDTCMEVNTSGLIKGVYKVHPDPLILSWAADMGVCLTMGSDAHAPTQVGQHFDEVRSMLREKGFSKLHYFEGRRRIAVPLADN